MEDEQGIDQDGMVDDFANDYENEPEIVEGQEEAEIDPSADLAENASNEIAKEPEENEAKNINSFVKDDGTFDIDMALSYAPDEKQTGTAYKEAITNNAIEQSPEEQNVDPYQQRMEEQINYEDNFKTNYFHGLNRVLELSQQYPNSNIQDIAREVERELERDTSDHFRKYGTERQTEWQKQTEQTRRQELEDSQNKGKFDMNLSSVMLETKLDHKKLDDLLFTPSKGGKVAEMLFSLARPEESKKAGKDYVDSYMSWFTSFGSNKQNLKTLVDVSKAMHIANNMNDITKAIREQSQNGKKQLKSASMQAPKTVTSLNKAAPDDFDDYLNS